MRNKKFKFKFLEKISNTPEKSSLNRYKNFYEYCVNLNNDIVSHHKEEKVEAGGDRLYLHLKNIIGPTIQLHTNNIKSFSYFISIITQDEQDQLQLCQFPPSSYK